MPTSGTVNFRATSDDGFSLSVNGVEVINQWQDRGCNIGSPVAIFFEAHKQYKLEGWYFENSGGQCVDLQMQQSGGIWGTVPAAAFNRAATQRTASAPAVVPVLSGGSVVVSRSSAVVSWLTDDGGLSASFEVQLSEDGVVWGPVKVSNVNSYSFTSLVPGKSYWVRIRGVNDVGASVSYLTSTFTTVALDVPQNLRVTARGVGSVSLAWDRPVEDPDLVDDYQIQYSVDGVVWNTFIDGVSLQTNATVTGLETGKTYYFRIAAVKEEISGESTGSGLAQVPPENLVAAGGSHVCVISSGVVRCWGSNTSGQLGDGTQVSRSAAVDVSLAGAVQVAAGGSHSCVVVISGSVYCWGENSSGQLGDGTLVNRLSPVKVLGISNAKQVSLGNSHSCALLTDKTVKCWGQNGDGRLGDGSLSNRLVPTIVQGVLNVKVVRAGYYHTCSLSESGSVKCWGSNAAGQTGGNNLGSLGVVSDVATQGDFTCALKSDATVWCWGWNNARQIVNSNSSVIYSPTKLSWASGAKSLDTGNDHICVVTTSGVVQCVGWNNMGQLGDGTFTNRTSPVTVSGISNVAFVIAGGGGFGSDFSCAVTNDSKFYCWGGNEGGQLGKNAGTNLSAPNLVGQTISAASLGVPSKTAEAPVLGSPILIATATSIRASVEVLSDGGLPWLCEFSIKSGSKTIKSSLLNVSTFTFTNLLSNKLHELGVNCSNAVGSVKVNLGNVFTKQLALLKAPQVPSILGKATSGSLLTVGLGKWTSGVTFSYLWKVDGKSVQSNKLATFKIPRGLKGKKITVAITASKQDHKSVRLVSRAITVKS
jgi:alpha-tubulin suppressor-like RCC1 family protein